MGPFSLQWTYSITPSSVAVPQYILTVTVLAAINMSKKVFVYRLTTNGTNVFEGVASPDQMLQVPEDAPDPESTYPNKFRTASVTMASEQSSVIDENLATIHAGLDKLPADLQTAYDLSNTTIVFSGVWGAAHSTDSKITGA